MSLVPLPNCGRARATNASEHREDEQHRLDRPPRRRVERLELRDERRLAEALRRPRLRGRSPTRWHAAYPKSATRAKRRDEDAREAT